MEGIRNIFSRHEKVTNELVEEVNEKLDGLGTDLSNLKPLLKTKFPNVVDKELQNEWYPRAQAALDGVIRHEDFVRLSSLVKTEVDAPPPHLNPEVGVFAMFNGENAARNEDWKERYLLKLSRIEDHIAQVRLSIKSNPTRQIRVLKPSSKLNRLLWSIETCFTWPSRKFKLEPGEFRGLVLNIIGSTIAALLVAFILYLVSGLAVPR